MKRGGRFAGEWGERGKVAGDKIACPTTRGVKGEEKAFFAKRIVHAGDPAPSRDKRCGLGKGSTAPFGHGSDCGFRDATRDLNSVFCLRNSL
jgi:hypothetical protein